MVQFVQAHTPRGKCPLAGNSVHCDKVFLDKYMKRFMEHLHYRIVDVSTVKELCRYGGITSGEPRALEVSPVSLIRVIEIVVKQVLFNSTALCLY